MIFIGFLTSCVGYGILRWYSRERYTENGFNLGVWIMCMGFFLMSVGI